MDAITQSVLNRTADALDNLDTAKTGAIHTVTITLDGHRGGVEVKVQTERSDDLYFWVI